MEVILNNIKKKNIKMFKNIINFVSILINKNLIIIDKLELKYMH